MQKGVHGSETNGIMTQSQKCIKYDKQSFLFDEHLSKGEREFFSLIKHKQGVSSNNYFSQSNPDVMLNLLRCLLTCIINHEDVFYFLHMNNDQFNTMLVLLIIFLYE
jgi:hypothetical protein